MDIITHDIELLLALRLHDLILRFLAPMGVLSLLGQLLNFVLNSTEVPSPVDELVRGFFGPIGRLFIACQRPYLEGQFPGELTPTHGFCLPWRESMQFLHFSEPPPKL